MNSYIYIIIFPCRTANKHRRVVVCGSHSHLSRCGFCILLLNHFGCFHGFHSHCCLFLRPGLLHLRRNLFC